MRFFILQIPSQRVLALDIEKGKLHLPQHREYYQGIEIFYLENTFKSLVEWYNKSLFRKSRLCLLKEWKFFQYLLNLLRKFLK